MSSVSDYNKEEWILLHSVPAMIGAAVLAAAAKEKDSAGDKIRLKEETRLTQVSTALRA